MKREPLSEGAIQRAIELALGAEPGLILMRNSVGVARYFDDDGKPRVVRHGLPNGSPDLVGILAPWGRWFALECKAPGERATPEQEHLHRVWREAGAFVATVHSVDQARAALAHARKEEPR